MKNVINNSPLILIFIASLFIISCKKKETPTPAIPYGTLYFHIHTNIAANEIDSGIVYTDSSGRHFQLNIAQFYISGIVLHKSDGTTFPLSNVYALKTIANEEFYVDTVPAGNYTSVSFNVGVDDAANAKPPTDYISTSPLYTQSPSMWFGSTTLGYMFMNIQGKADTSSANTGTVNYPFILELGGSTALRTISMPAQAFTVVSNSTQYIHIVADYGKLFQGVHFTDFLNNIPTTTFGNPQVCGQVADNIPNMFRYE